MDLEGAGQEVVLGLTQPLVDSVSFWAFIIKKKTRYVNISYLCLEKYILYRFNFIINMLYRAFSNWCFFSLSMIEYNLCENILKLLCIVNQYGTIYNLGQKTRTLCSLCTINSYYDFRPTIQKNPLVHK